MDSCFGLGRRKFRKEIPVHRGKMSSINLDLKSTRLGMDVKAYEPGTEPECVKAARFSNQNGPTGKTRLSVQKRACSIHTPTVISRNSLAFLKRLNPLTPRVKPWVIQSFLTFDSKYKTFKCDHSLESC